MKKQLNLPVASAQTLPCTNPSPFIDPQFPGDRSSPHTRSRFFSTRKSSKLTSASSPQQQQIFFLLERSPAAARTKQKPILITQYLDYCNKDCLDASNKPRSLSKPPPASLPTTRRATPKRFQNIDYCSKFLQLPLPTKEFRARDLLTNPPHSARSSIHWQQWKNNSCLHNNDVIFSRAALQRSIRCKEAEKVPLPISFELNQINVNIEKIKRLKMYQRVSKEIVQRMNDKYQQILL